MRTVAVVVAGSAAATLAAGQVAEGSARVNDPEHIRYLNSLPEVHWVAAPQPFFEGLTFDDAGALLGATLSNISEHLSATLPEDVYAAISDVLVPHDFDSRAQWPGLIHPIRNQESCGSCWAFSATEVLSDRVAIVKGTPTPVLSPENLVGCDELNFGCHGGSLALAWLYLTRAGVVTDSCMPYTAGHGKAPTCTRTCADSEAFVRTKAKYAYAIFGAVHMQKDIMTHGPIQVAFMVFKSFMVYKSGVYHKLRDEFRPEGGHAVKIVGWGVDGMNYWLVANSWSISWGEDGFFRIERGKNACGIELMGPPFAGHPLTDEGLIVV